VTEFPYSSFSQDSPPPLKKTRIEDFEELCDPDEDTNPVRNEVAEYVNLKVAKKLNSDMMQSWSYRRTQSPKLFAVARRVLCIPPASSPSERV